MSNNTIIPKEQLTAFERWEMVSFDAKPNATKNGATKNTGTQAVSTEPPPPAFPTAAELEHIREQAHQEGYRTGFQEGFQRGHSDGMQQADTAIAQLQAVLGNLQQAVNQIDAEIAQSLLDLSLEIAHKMVCSTIKTHPEVIIKIVSDAINNLPHFNQNAHLILHPDDAELVRQEMGEQLVHSGWKIFTDHQIERGGCRLETAHSQIDASNRARWQRIIESIGQDNTWQR